MGEIMIRRHRLVFVVVWLAVSGFYEDQAAWGQLRRRQQPPAAAPQAQTPAAAAPAPVEPLRTAGDRPIDIQHIRLDLRVDLPKKTVDSHAALRFRSLRRISSITLDAMEFEVTKVTLGAEGQDATSVTFAHDGKKLVIDLPAAWPADKTGTLHIDYKVREPRAGLHFFGPAPAEPDIPLEVWSQGESETNRYWVPCFDHPNQRQTTEMVATVAEGFEALSNGKLVERQENKDKTTTFHWLQDKPHVAYLITLVVGKFDIVQEDWNGIPVLYYVPKGHKSDVARSFGRTRDMLTFFSDRYGIKYPWDKYAQVVCEQYGGGMENTSATTLGERALHDERSMLDSTPDGLISHELAHQWWGDLVTCRDWAHIWLNEGFASYAEVLWAEHHDGAEEGAYNLVQKSRPAISGGKERPVVDRRYSNSQAMFDSRAYPKGAWVLHMLRRQLGDDAFFKCLQEYGNEFRLQCADTNDFRRVLEKVTGRSLERFFYDWTERAGNPVLNITTDYQPDSKQARISIKQTQAGEAFHFPLKILLMVGGQSPIVREEEITEKEQVILESLPGRPTMVCIDPDQSLLAEIEETKGRDLWIAQLTHGDVAGKVRAAQHLGKTKLPADQAALAKALAEEKFWGVQAEIATALGESGGTVSRDALIQGLKHQHPKVRRACAEQLAKFPQDTTVAQALKAVLDKGDPSYFVEAAAIGSYAQLRQPDTIHVLSPWLEKPSYFEVIRSAALRGMGDSQDMSALETLAEWTKRGKPRMCRSSALQALAQLARTTNPTDAQHKQVVQVVSVCLEEQHPVVLFAAVGALSQLGKAASSALPALNALASHHPMEGVRDSAKQAAKAIESNTPPPVEVTRLREEVDRLKKSQEDLQERLNRFEKAKAGSKEGQTK
jgi:aminopeptidase N